MRIRVVGPVRLQIDLDLEYSVNNSELAELLKVIEEINSSITLGLGDEKKVSEDN